MADVHTKAVRSYNMSRIRSKDTRPEIAVRKAIFAQGFRFRLHDIKLPGKPDIVLKKYNIVIFINGCFWHGHESCKYFVVPKTRPEWWIQKINRNKELDAINAEKIKNIGWKVITIHECEIKGDKFDQAIKNLVARILAKQ